MTEDRKRLLKNYIANLHVNVEVAEYTHCWETWRELDYVPGCNKFYFICEGEGWLKIGDREFYPKPGELYLLPEGVMQSYSAISKNTFKKHWCHFTAKIGDKNLFDIIRLPCRVKITDRDYVANLFTRLSYNSKSSELDGIIRAKSLLLEIIAHYVENAVVEDIRLVESESTRKLNYIMDYIECNLGENITVEQLAAMLHFHPNYFIRFFKNHIGTSPIHYINKRKMEKAKNLLSIADMTVTEVAEELGYKDLFHFSKNFKAFTGFSPSEFKASAAKTFL